MTVAEAKRKYNELLIRFEKANNYFDNTNIPHAEKEKFLENFQEIINGLNYLLSKIEVFTQQDILEGFDFG